MMFNLVFFFAILNLCGYDFVIGGYNNVMYIGVMGASPESKVPEFVSQKQEERLFNPATHYAQFGILLLHSLLQGREFAEVTHGEKHMFLPFQYFYPVYESPRSYQLFNGELPLPVSPLNYAVHWYGGHPLSQCFNASYTEEFAKESTDSISVYCRKIKVI